MSSEEVPSLADDAEIVEAAKEVAREAAPEDAQVVENDLLQFLRSARVKESSPDPVPAEAMVTESAAAAAADETAPVAAPSFNFLMEMMLEEEKGGDCSGVAGYLEVIFLPVVKFEIRIFP